MYLSSSPFSRCSLWLFHMLPSFPIRTFPARPELNLDHMGQKRSFRRFPRFSADFLYIGSNFDWLFRHFTANSFLCLSNR